MKIEKGQIVTKDKRAKNIPHRSFKKGHYHIPITEQNIKYLLGFGMVTDEVQHLIDRYHSWNGNYTHDHFKTEPYEVQKIAVNNVINQRVYALFMEMGLGKTKVSIDDANFQFGMNRINTAVVFCPNSVKSTWEEEIKTHSLVDFNIFVLEARKKHKVKNFSEEIFQGIKWLIVGIEAMSQGKQPAVVSEFMESQDCAMYIDESSMIKNAQSNRTQVICELGYMAVCKRILSGTPMSKGMEDLYSQFYYLDPSIFKHPNFYTFRNTYCKMGGYKNKQVTGYHNLDELYERINPVTYRAMKKDWLDLPDKIYEKREVEMSDKQKEYYIKMKDDLLIMFESGQLEATTTLTQFLRLQQIIGGFIPIERLNEEGMPLGKWDYQPIPGRNAKIEELILIMEQVEGKAIIWCKYKAEINLIRDALIKLGRNPVIAHGGISSEDRTNNRMAFQEDPSVTDFVAQIDSMGIGITLTAAEYVFYYSNSMSYITRAQSEDRAHRIGQHKSVTYIDFIMKGTIDVKIMKSLAKKEDLSRQIMSGGLQQILED